MLSCTSSGPPVAACDTRVLLGGWLQESLAGILDLFASEAVLGPHYFFAHFDDMRT